MNAKEHREVVLPQVFTGVPIKTPAWYYLNNKAVIWIIQDPSNGDILELSYIEARKYLTNRL
jgi:hypothetical protein